MFRIHMGIPVSILTIFLPLQLDMAKGFGNLILKIILLLQEESFGYMDPIKVI